MWLQFHMNVHDTQNKKPAYLIVARPLLFHCFGFIFTKLATLFPVLNNNKNISMEDKINEKNFQDFLYSSGNECLYLKWKQLLNYSETSTEWNIAITSFVDELTKPDVCNFLLFKLFTIWLTPQLKKHNNLLQNEKTLKNLTKGTITAIEPLPDVMIKLLEDGGLIEHIKKNGDLVLG